MTAQSRRNVAAADGYVLHSWADGRCWVMAWKAGVPFQVHCSDGPMIYPAHAAGVRAVARITPAPLLRVEWMEPLT